MEPFYERSQLTQRRRGGFLGADTIGTVTKGAAEVPVKVVEVKTVGPYEVAVLSAKDADRLERWLKVHAYSVYEATGDLIDEYVRKGWYFVVAIHAEHPEPATGLDDVTRSRPPGLILEDGRLIIVCGTSRRSSGKACRTRCPTRWTDIPIPRPTIWPSACR